MSTTPPNFQLCCKPDRKEVPSICIQSEMQHGRSKIISDLFTGNMITHSTAPQTMIQTANQMPRNPQGKKSSVWRAQRENNANRGNCIRADEAFMHVHIRSMREEHEEHVDTNTKRCGRTNDQDPV